MGSPDPSQTADHLVLRISPQDNVAVAAATIEAGESVTADGASIVCVDGIPAGHKLALSHIAAGEKVIRYGAPIGSATREIRPGGHVHTHNLKSDYLRTYTLEEGERYLDEC